MSTKIDPWLKQKHGILLWVADFKLDEATPIVPSSKTTAANFLILCKDLANHNIDAVADSRDDCTYT